MRGVLALLCFLAVSQAVTFDLNPYEPTCVGEEIGVDVLVQASYKVPLLGPSQYVLRISAPEESNSQVLHEKTAQPEGTFAFHADQPGVYQFCFIPQAGNANFGSPLRVKLDIKSGWETKDYGEIAKKEHLKPLEVELRKLEDKCEELNSNMLYLRKREERRWKPWKVYDQKANPSRD
eukprot:TRINITY_DN8340_c0_g1_i6.p1 TRINITY_DN8340_c0_g1~~TRINITY_DN8340_c0_g1_i6.p1  ORF type:complete len:178 (-),score=8.27 TRINITY_DN8340_c0_g1_i6:120-653(-)